MLEFDNRPEELLGFLRRADQANTKLAVFVHSFFGGYLSTWAAYLPRRVQPRYRLRLLP
jgi:hypothetical protein